MHCIHDRGHAYILRMKKHSKKIFAALIIGVILLLISKTAAMELLANILAKQMLACFLPSFCYAFETDAPKEVTQYLMTKNIPIAGYAYDSMMGEKQAEDELFYEQLMLLEGADEQDAKAAQAEEEMSDFWEEFLKQDDISSSEEPGDESKLQPPVLQSELHLEEYQDFAKLVRDFYVIDKTTSVDHTQLNIESLMNRDESLQQSENGEEGTILIYHTHASECYEDSRENEWTDSVVGVGEELAEKLRGLGYKVIHDTSYYDRENRNYAYQIAGEALQKMLESHPEIDVIIDVHRDGVSDGKRLVADVNGEEMAQVMFFNGLSRTTKMGDISYLKNDYIQDNLAFAFQLQVAARQYYPNLTRKIYLKGYRYNLHYRPKSLLVEVGAQTNTVAEAKKAMGPLAYTLDMVLRPDEKTSSDGMPQ